MRFFVGIILILWLYQQIQSHRLTTENSIDSSIDLEWNTLKRQAVVKLPKYGILQGSIASSAWTNRIIYQFLGVKYAESPSGARRFKAPVPIKPWHGIRNAEHYGRACPFLGDLAELPENEWKHIDIEDCLSMTIYSTSLNVSALAPVMVYVHGGGFQMNSAKNYPPNYFMERDIVLVVVQYRLDALGFLSTNTNEIPGNAGLLDTILALRFVKENIDNFGGDSNRMTIFGQSSGAAMVSALIISPKVQENSLFQRAIVQSGSVLANWAYSMDPINDSRDIAAVAGLNRNQSLASLNRAFMAMDVVDLLTAVDRYHMVGARNGEMRIGARSLSVGGPNNLLPQSPAKLIRDFGKCNKSIPLIVGTTRDDGSYIATVVYDLLTAMGVLTNKKFMKHELFDNLIHFLGIDNDGTGTVQALSQLIYWNKEQLMSGDFRILAPGLIDMFGTLMFKGPAFKLAQSNAKTNPSKTYLYSFDHRGQYTRFGYGSDTTHYPFNGGIHHSDDLIYLFPYPKNVAVLNDADRKISHILLDLWTSFAENGIPKTGESNEKESWPSLSELVGPYLHINRTLGIGENYINEFNVETREPNYARNDYYYFLFNKTQTQSD